MNSSFIEGTQSEKDFINLRGSSFIRKSTKDEDINEHWDILDKEFGRVDVKAAKRKYRNGPIDYTIWWELRTVKRPPHWKASLGWGVPNGIDRLIPIGRALEFSEIWDGYDLIRNLSRIIDLK